MPVIEHSSLKYIASYFGNKYVYLQRKLRLWCEQHVAGAAACLTNSFSPVSLLVKHWFGRGDGCPILPHVTVETDFTLLPGSKGNPDDRGGCVGVVCGQLCGSTTFPSESRKQASQSHCLSLFQMTASKRNSGQDLQRGWCYSSRDGWSCIGGQVRGCQQLPGTNLRNYTRRCLRLRSIRVNSSDLLG